MIKLGFLSKMSRVRSKALATRAEQMIRLSIPNRNFHPVIRHREIEKIVRWPYSYRFPGLPVLFEERIGKAADFGLGSAGHNSEVRLKRC
jgi:hypothetical protein